MDFQSSINKSKNLINNENFNIKKDSLLDSTSYSLFKNKKIYSLKQPHKKKNNSKINEINSFLINKDTNNGRFPICFSSMTNKQNFNNILSSKFNYKANLNQKSDYKSIDLPSNESIITKINKNNENDTTFYEENSRTRKKNEINLNLKFFSPKNNSSTINFSINNIFTKKNNFSRNEIKPILKNISNYMNTLQLNSFSKDGLSFLNNSSIISNVCMGSPIKLFQNNSMSSIKKKMFNKPILKLKKKILSPLPNKKIKKFPGLKNLNELSDKKLLLDKTINNSILNNKEYKKDDNNSKNNDELTKEINELILNTKKLNNLEKNLGIGNRKNISRNMNIISKDKKEENKLLLTSKVSNKNGILRKNSNVTKKNMFLKRNIIPLRKSSSVKIKFNLEKDISKTKDKNNKKDYSKESNLKSEMKNTSNNNSNNSSFSSKNPQKIKKHPSLKLNESNKESSSSDRNKNKTFIRRRKRKTMSVKEYYSNMCYGIEDKQKTKIIQNVKKIPFLESYNSPKANNFYKKNKFVSNFINPRAELISLNTEKKIKFFKTKLILSEKLYLLSFEEKIKKKLNNFKIPNNDEIKINFKKCYCPKYENIDNKTIIIKNIFEVNINKVINPKINFGLKYKLIKFLLKTVNLTSIYLPNISDPQSVSENLQYFKLERFHEFRNYFNASNKSKFIEDRYDMAYIEKNFPHGNDIFKRDLFSKKDENVNENIYISSNNSYENNKKEEIFPTKGKISNISYEEEKDKLKILPMKSCKELKPLIMNNFSLLKEKKFFYNPKKPTLAKGKRRLFSKDFGIRRGDRANDNPTIKKLRKIYDTIKLFKKKSQNYDIPQEDNDDDDEKKEDDFFKYLKVLLVSGEIDYFNEYFDSISKFININQKDENGNTLLILATLHGHNAIVKNLLEKGADINEKNKKGNTALHYAISQKYFSLADILTKFGAKEDIKNIFGLTPWECIGKSVEEYSY